MIHHQVGDLFTCEHIFPTPMLQMACWKQLCNMPGVFVFTWVNCRFGVQYRHTQVLITNAPLFAPLAKDCTNRSERVDHVHLRIGFDKDLQTKDVAAYPWGWCRAYAACLSAFVKDPGENRCVHCQQQGDADCVYSRRDVVRRAAELIDREITK